MFTSPEDWYLRLRNAGGTVELTPDAMLQGSAHVSSECEVVWNEILGQTNLGKWRQVEEYLRSMSMQLAGRKKQ